MESERVSERETETERERRERQRKRKREREREREREGEKGTRYVYICNLHRQGQEIQHGRRPVHTIFFSLLPPPASLLM